MAKVNVETFEWTGGDFRRRAPSADLTTASAGLPAGAYTTLRTYHGRRVLRLSQHVQRLLDSARLQGTPGELPETLVRRGLATALDATRFSESRVRLTFAPPRLFVSVERFEPLPRELYATGASCILLTLQRDKPRAKDTRFLAVARTAYEALPPGVHEVLMVGDDGSILEGLSSNFFAVLDGVLRTEEGRVLLGVTRSLVLEAAAGTLPVSTNAVKATDLPLITEAFITSVSRGILPVTRIEESAVGDGLAGPKTRAIMARFAEMEERETEEV